MRYLLDVQEGSCDKTQQGLTYLTGNVRIASSYSPATSDKALPGAMAGSGGAAGTAGAGQSQPTDDHADQRQHNGRGGPESPGGQAVNRGGGWLRNVRGHQHGMHKPPEQGGCSQGGENKSEGSFHRFCFDHSPLSNSG